MLILKELFKDREYFTNLFKIGFPIAAQNFLFSGLLVLSGLMVGQKGEVSVAAAGLANQIFFLLNLILFGVASGTAMFTAQLWGKQDIVSIHKVLGLSLITGLITSIFFIIISLTIPEKILGLYSTDPAVIALGTDYLAIFAWSFIPFAIGFSYIFVLRSMGDSRLPTITSIGAMVLNIILSYGLIFGKLGMPEMGVLGSALANMIVRFAEAIFLIAAVYYQKSPAAASLRELLDFNLVFAWKIYKPVLPVILNEFLWASAITTYSAIYARMSTAAIATINITSAIEGFAFTLMIGIANATAVMIGNLIGAGENNKAYRYGVYALILAVVNAVFVGGLTILLRVPLLSLYKVSPEVIENAQHVLLIFGIMIFLRQMNSALIIGIFRSGGDIRFSLLVDGVVIWVVGVPVVALLAFYFHLPIYWVYAGTLAEEIVKFAISLPRFLSRKWMNDLAQTVSPNITINSNLAE